MKSEFFYCSAFLFLLPISLFSILYCFLAIGSVTAVLFVWDKFAAVTERRRIPEKVLLFWSFAGGSPFALAAMLICHHKTSKPGFFIPFLLIAALQAAAVWMLASRFPDLKNLIDSGILSLKL